MSMTAINLMDPEFTTNPAAAYGRLREEAPVVPVNFPGVAAPVWLITRYEDVKAALTDPRFVVDRNNVPGLNEPSARDQIMEAMGVPEDLRPHLTTMVNMDGRAHSRLRTLVSPAFTSRRMDALRSRVEIVAAQLADDLRRKPEPDLLADFSAHLSGTIICELVGVDEADRAEVRGWIQGFAGDDQTRILERARLLVNYTKDLIARRRAEPGDDTISKLLAAEADGDQLTDTEIVTMFTMLIQTGYVTTAHFIPNAVVTLLDHPDQLDRLRADPELLPHAVDELLRVAGPITVGTMMYATEDLNLAGTPIRRGDTLAGCLVSANHDPRVFDDPDRFDIARIPASGRNHLAFYYGSHFCLGARLAEVESEVALRELLLARDGLSLAIERNQLEHHPNPIGNLLVRLPVHF
ncbi:cytochrome P450 family protein [Nocardia arthritidis]|nr:cytochrome P450 [Nocardia arthritidis]